MGIQDVFAQATIPGPPGIEISAGIYAEEVFDINLVTEGTSSPQDMSAGGVFTIGGVDFTITNSGTPTTVGTTANGFECTDDAGSGTSSSKLAFPMSGITAAAGDVVMVLVEMKVAASGDNQDRFFARFLDDASTPSSYQHNIVVSRTSATDWRWGISNGAGVPNNGQLSTVTPQDIRFAMVTDGSRTDSWVDNAGGSISLPSDAVYRGSTNTNAIANGTSVGSRQTPWTNLDWWHIALVAQDSDASFYITRIACMVVRNTYGNE